MLDGMEAHTSLQGKFLLCVDKQTRILTDTTSCAFQPTAGKLYAHYSSKWIFLGFLGVFELGSLLCGVAQSSTMLIIGRAVAGIGTSGIMNGAFTIINACVPMHKVPGMCPDLTFE